MRQKIRLCQQRLDLADGQIAVQRHVDAITHHLGRLLHQQVDLAGGDEEALGKIVVDASVTVATPTATTGTPRVSYLRAWRLLRAASPGMMPPVDS